MYWFTSFTVPNKCQVLTSRRLKSKRIWKKLAATTLLTNLGILVQKLWLENWIAPSPLCPIATSFLLIWKIAKFDNQHILLWAFEARIFDKKNEFKCDRLKILALVLEQNFEKMAKVHQATSSLNSRLDFWLRMKMKTLALKYKDFNIFLTISRNYTSEKSFKDWKP